jgi:hypothetical protein
MSVRTFDLNVESNTPKQQLGAKESYGQRQVPLDEEFMFLGDPLKMRNRKQKAATRKLGHVPTAPHHPGKQEHNKENHQPNHAPHTPKTKKGKKEKTQHAEHHVAHATDSYYGAKSAMELLMRFIFSTPQYSNSVHMMKPTDVHFTPGLLKVARATFHEKLVAGRRLSLAGSFGIGIMSKCIGILKKWGIRDNKMDLYLALFDKDGSLAITARAAVAASDAAAAAATAAADPVAAAAAAAAAGAVVAVGGDDEAGALVADADGDTDDEDAPAGGAARSKKRRAVGGAPVAPAHGGNGGISGMQVDPVDTADDVASFIRQAVSKKAKQDYLNATSKAFPVDGKFDFSALGLAGLWDEEEKQLLMEMVFDVSRHCETLEKLQNFIGIEKFFENVDKFSTAWNTVENLIVTKQIKPALEQLPELSPEQTTHINDMAGTAITLLMKELIVGETLKLHNCAMKFISTTFKIMYHEETGHKICGMYMNAVKNTLNGSGLGFDAKHMEQVHDVLSNVMNGLKPPSTKFEKFRAELQVVNTKNVSLYEVLGYQKLYNQPKIQSQLMERVWKSIVEEKFQDVAHGVSRGDAHVTFIPVDHRSGLNSMYKQCVEKVVSKIDIRRKFIESSYPTIEGQYPGHDICLLENTKSIKENLQKLTQKIPLSLDVESTANLCNMLGLLAVPIHQTTAFHITPPPAANIKAISDACARVLTLKNDIQVIDGSLAASVNSKETNTSLQVITDYTHDIQRLIKEQATHLNTVNSALIVYASRMAPTIGVHRSCGFLRTEMMTSVFGAPSYARQFYFNQYCQDFRGMGLTGQILWSHVSHVLNNLNYAGWDNVKNMITTIGKGATLDITSSIYADMINKRYSRYALRDVLSKIPELTRDVLPGSHVIRKSEDDPEYNLVPKA